MLRDVQAHWARGFSGEAPGEFPERAAGLDVSYISERQAVGAYALVHIPTGELEWSFTIEREVRFPYISTYLAFRELPILWDLIEVASAAGRLADVFLVDGSGILHPRRGGVATCFGVSTDLATIGVTKTLLHGRPDEEKLPVGQWTYVRDEGEILGAAIRTSPRSRKPIYVSPGHRMNTDAAIETVDRLALGRKLPEPIYWADRLSREAARKCKYSLGSA
jgi:deoxyribonuclease V